MYWRWRRLVALSYVVFVGDPEAIDTGTDEELLRFAASALVGAGVVWVSTVMRRDASARPSPSGEAVASVRTMSELQRLATALTAAVTPTDVAHALIEFTPPLLGARGGALGPGRRGGARHRRPARRQLADARAGLPASARDARSDRGSREQRCPVRVRDRETFERDYPDGAALTLYAQGALAVPVRAGGEVVGR